MSEEEEEEDEDGGEAFLLLLFILLLSCCFCCWKIASKQEYKQVKNGQIRFPKQSGGQSSNFLMASSNAFDTSRSVTLKRVKAVVLVSADVVVVVVMLFAEIKGFEIADARNTSQTEIQYGHAANNH